MLTSFVLNPQVERKWDKQALSITLNPKGYEAKSSLFESLYAALSWAMAHEEDLIYCICEEKATVDFDFILLEKVLLDVVPERVNLLIIDAEFETAIPIHQYCQVIEGVKSISSFILAKPIFGLALSVLENMDNESDMEWLDFVRFLAPHSFALSLQTDRRAYSPKFHLISPFRNASMYLSDYLHSIHRQVYQNFTAYLIDDCSVDGSSDLIRENHQIKKRVNTKRKYALQNIVDVLIEENIKDDDIVCLVDADDRLSHKYVLSLLSNVYIDKNIMMTYGSLQYMNEHPRYGVPYSRQDFTDLRNSPWKGAPLRTFKYRLFKELIHQDPRLSNLRDSQGNILRMPYDMALLFPLMELAGFERVRFIYSPLYEYRLHNQNDQYANRPEQHRGEIEVRGKKALKQASF